MLGRISLVRKCRNKYWVLKQQVNYNSPQYLYSSFYQLIVHLATLESVTDMKNDISSFLNNVQDHGDKLYLLMACVAK